MLKIFLKNTYLTGNSYKPFQFTYLGLFAHSNKRFMHFTNSIGATIVKAVPASLTIILEAANITTEIRSITVLAKFSVTVITHLVIHYIRLNFNLNKLFISNFIKYIHTRLVLSECGIFTKRPAMAATYDLKVLKVTLAAPFGYFISGSTSIPA